MQGFYSLDECYELSNVYSSTSNSTRSKLKGVMVNDAGAEMQAAAKERVCGSSTPLCRGSASSSQEEERLIALDGPSYISQRRHLQRLEDDPLTKTKLKGFYFITFLLTLYTTVYFTYLIMRPK